MPGSSSWMPYAPQGLKGFDDDDDDDISFLSVNTPQFHFHVLLKENLFFIAEISKYCIILIWYKLPIFQSNLKLPLLLLLLLLPPLALQPTVGFGLSNNVLPFFPICHQLSPSSHSQHFKISFYFLFPSFPGSSPSSRPFQFLIEDLSGHPILLHSL